MRRFSFVRSRPLRGLLLTGALVFAAACSSSEPTGEGGPATLVFRPVLATAPNLAAFNLAVDQMHVQVYRPQREEVVVDTTADFSLDQKQLRLGIGVLLEQSPEDFVVVVELLGGGQTLFSGSASVTVTRDGGPALPPAIPLTYIGPGSEVVRVQLAPVDTGITAGGRFSIQATAFNAAGAPVTQYYLSWSVDAPINGAVSAVGEFVAPNRRGSALVRALTPAGIGDSIKVFYGPPAASIQKIAGDNQVGLTGAFLTQPLVVQLDASDGQPVVGVPVTFTATNGGTVVPPVVVATDTKGQARATVALGPGAGPFTFTATAAGVPTATFTATTSAAALQVIFASDSAFGLTLGVFGANGDGSALTKVAAPPTVDETNPRWSPDRTRAVYTFYDVSGFSGYQLAVTSADGLASAVLVNDSSAHYPRFSPNGRHLAFNCGDGYSSGQDVCSIDDASGPVAGLAGIGNGLGKRYLTDQVTTRPDGPGAFAWEPLGGDSLVFARDTTPVAGGATGSGLYVSAYNGTGYRALAATADNILTLGADTIRVEEITWAPNGTFLVFTGFVYDPVQQRDFRRLYRINRDGTNLTQLTAPPVLIEDEHPTISPDNSQIAFLRGDLGDGLLSGDFFRMPATGGGVTQITAEGNTYGSPNDRRTTIDWSPSGTQLVLVGTDGQSNLEVYVVNSTTTAATYLADRQVVGRLGATEDTQAFWRP